jgi:hypothetical protein
LRTASASFSASGEGQQNNGLVVLALIAAERT